MNQDGLPFKDAVDGRVEIDKAAQGLDVPLTEGDTIVCAHGIGVLVECRGPDDPCVVEIEIGDVKHDSVFGAMKGNDALSGCVRRPPILFSRSGARKVRKDSIQPSVKAKVTDIILSAVRDGSCLLIVVFAQVQKCYEDNCATSPCMKDKVRKRLGTGFYLLAQMMVMMCTFASLYHNFKTTYPELFLHQAASAIGHVATLSFSAFHKLRPWNLRKTNHESCLCKGWCSACPSVVGLTYLPVVSQRVRTLLIMRQD